MIVKSVKTSIIYKNNWRKKKRKCRRVKSICRTRPHECLVDQRISRAKARYWLAWKRHSAIDSTMETCGFWTTDRQIANNLILVSDLVALVPISRDTRIAPSRWKHKWKKNKRNGLKNSLVNVKLINIRRLFIKRNKHNWWKIGKLRREVSAVPWEIDRSRWNLLEKNDTSEVFCEFCKICNCRKVYLYWFILSFL